ncbi:hypothetical protein RIF29_17797 [Crotalaria pallida]|uniref:Uncharacterized protein n=1 Tax=Crotalaria pallida TaxID=3830 RepID=A0AAN9IDA5_CROPI
MEMEMERYRSRRMGKVVHTKIIILGFVDGEIRVLKNENPVVSSCPVDGLPLANGDPVDGFSLALEDTGLTLGQTMDCSLKNENPAVSSHHVDGFL